MSVKLFGRRQTTRTRERLAEADTTRLYYASDIHGTEGLWRKFLNAASAYREMFAAIPEGLTYLALHFTAPGDFGMKAGSCRLVAPSA